ncbi:MAG: NADP-dependent oxidoreductase [Acidimicrobiia bacterium]
MAKNRQIVLRERPVGMIDESCFEVIESPVPDPGPGEALVRVEYVSLDPAMRGWLDAGDTYVSAVGIGEVMRSGGLGEVVASNDPAVPVGATASGFVGWQDYALVGGEREQPIVLPDGIEPLDALSVYGGTGLTAYFGMLEVGRAKDGETVVVSGAAGATGSAAGQIALILGCRVVGIAGTDEKCSWVADGLGFDACINYRTEDVGACLRETCPDGIDVFFDNVGGEILDLVLARINDYARIVLCGAISNYNAVELPPGPRNVGNLIVHRGRMEGFIVLDYRERFLEAILALAGWVGEGRLKHRVDVVEGLEQAPRAINRLFTGENTGKLVVKVA